MWIRSQDKARLFNVDGVYLKDVSAEKRNSTDPFEYEYRFTEVYESTYDCIIGRYATSERALQVLDEILKGICYTKRTELYAGQINMSDTDMMHFVFQMPTE